MASEKKCSCCKQRFRKMKTYVEDVKLCGYCCNAADLLCILDNLDMYAAIQVVRSWGEAEEIGRWTQLKLDKAGWTWADFDRARGDK